MTTNTAHLGAYLLDAIMYKDTTLFQDIKLYTPIAFFIAAKTIEKDERIPYIPRLRKNSCMNYQVGDFKKAELKILEMLEWNAHYTTTLDFFEFFLS